MILNKVNFLNNKSIFYKKTFTFAIKKEQVEFSTSSLSLLFNFYLIVIFFPFDFFLDILSKIFSILFESTFITVKVIFFNLYL